MERSSCSRSEDHLLLLVLLLFVVRCGDFSYGVRHAPSFFFQQAILIKPVLPQMLFVELAWNHIILFVKPLLFSRCLQQLQHWFHLGCKLSIRRISKRRLVFTRMTNGPQEHPSCFVIHGLGWESRWSSQWACRLPGAGVWFVYLVTSR